MNAVVHLAAVSRVHGEGATRVHALRSVTFRAHPGELVAVMGPSGSGKSTLMHLLAGLDTPDAGAVHIAGEDITRMSDRELTRLRRKHIGFIFQSFNLLPTLSAEENVTLPLAIAAGLAIGKQVGIFASIVVADRLGFAARPENETKPLVDRKQTNPMFNDQKMKLGLFGTNCSYGLIMSHAPTTARNASARGSDPASPTPAIAVP